MALVGIECERSKKTAKPGSPLDWKPVPSFIERPNERPRADHTQKNNCLARGCFVKMKKIEVD